MTLGCEAVIRRKLKALTDAQLIALEGELASDPYWCSEAVWRRIELSGKGPQNPPSPKRQKTS